MTVEKGTLPLLPICGLIMLMAFTTFVSSPVQAADTNTTTTPIPGHFYLIKNIQTSQYINLQHDFLFWKLLQDFFLPKDGVLVDQDPLDGCPCQIWLLVPASQGVEIINSISNKCLDVNQHSHVYGLQLEQWDCNGGTNQQWIISPSPGSLGTIITNVSNGLVLSSNHGLKKLDNPIIQWGFNGTNDQQWIFECVNNDGSPTTCSR